MITITEFRLIIHEDWIEGKPDSQDNGPCYKGREKFPDIFDPEVHNQGDDSCDDLRAKYTG